MEAPNLNTGKPWSPGEIADLKFALDRGDTVESIADFLCRTKAEVRKRAAAMERAAKHEAADAPRWHGAKPCFVRYGPLPPDGRSRNHRTGCLEAGISVMHGEVLPSGEARPTVRTYREFLTVLELQRRRLYLATGREVGVGSDGEPLLAECSVQPADKSRAKCAAVTTTS